MSNANFNTINVKQLNFTGDHILKRGQPTMLATLDMSGVGHYKRLCVDNLAVGKGKSDCIDLNYVLDVSGASKLSGFIHDSSSTHGGLGQVITATASGWAWQDPSNGGVTVQSKWLTGNSGQGTSTIYHSNPSYPSGLNLARVGIGNFSGQTSLTGQAKATLDVDSGTSTESMRSSFKLGTISSTGVFQNAPFSAMMGDGNSLNGVNEGSSFVLGHDCSLNGWSCAAIGRHNVVNMPNVGSNFGSAGAIALGNYAYAGIKGGSAGTGDIGFAIGTGTESGSISGQPTYSSNNNKFVIDIDGNVGIGTNAPSEKLEVNGTVKATSGFYGTIYTQAQPNITSVGTLTGLSVSGGIGIGAVDDQGLHPFRVDTNGTLTTPSILIPNGSITSENATIDFWCKIGPPNSLQSQYPLEVHGSDGIMSPYYWNVTGGIEIEGKGTGGYKALPYAGQNAVGVSILADAFIWAKGGFMLSSDRRIKENIRDVSDNVSLQQLRDISCCFYEYKDKLSKGWYTTIGFIAQQVKEHLPSAVSLHKSVIPNEMRNIENPQWSNAMDASMNNVYKLTIPDLEDVSGNTKYKFFVTNDPSGGEITKEISSMENDPKSFIFEEQWQNLFLYGKEVNDFHTLDKDNIYAVHFSASQEMDRVQQEEKTKLVFAKAKISVLESENKELKARLTSIEARLDAAGI